MSRRRTYGGDKGVRYINWKITSVEGNPPTYGWAAQASEFTIYDANKNRIYYGSNVVATCTPYVSHDNSSIQYADKLVDNITNSGKFYNPSQPPMTITIDLGILVDVAYYGYYTADDDYNRDPNSWIVEFSQDGINFKEVDRKNSVSIPSARKALAGIWKVDWL